jgi:hypothetical protein
MNSVLFQASRRGMLLGALVAVVLLACSGAVQAGACKVELITGQWQHVNDRSRWAFFSNKRVDCRMCKEWDGGCIYVRDLNDEQGRKQCTWTNGRETSTVAPDGKVTVTGWEGRNGVLDRIIFSDGTVRNVAKDCDINGTDGTMTIQGIGDFQCLYNYQCDKLSREEEKK